MNTPPTHARHYSRRELAELLSATIGREKAEASVNFAAKALGFELTRSEALGVLEKLAEAPGLPGIAARFAKSHLILHPTES